MNMSVTAHVNEALEAARLLQRPARADLSVDASRTFGQTMSHKSRRSGRESLRARGRECVRRYDRMLKLRRGVYDHVVRLENAVTTTTEVIRTPSGMKRHSPATSLAVLLRGQAFRSIGRETFHIEQGTLPKRVAAQMMCLRSLRDKLFVPFELAGHRVDVFLTLYKHLSGPLEVLMEPLRSRVVSVTTVQQFSTPSQLLSLGAAIRAFLSWCTTHDATYSAVVVTRFDVYLKANMHALMGDSRKIDGFRFLFREAGGHWRHHSMRAATNRTFAMGVGGWKTNSRAPDALLAFPFSYTRCFLGAVRNELFPIRNESRPLSFLHNMIPALRRALPDATDQPPAYTYLVAGQFDSNPCRATCMMNPIYDLQPRMGWVTASRICQRMEDFTYDPASESLCCPSPDYCCPNSVTSCRDPGAIRFDVEKANVPIDAIVHMWPLQLGRPYSWELTPRSREIVRDAWLRAAKSRVRTTQWEARPKPATAGEYRNAANALMASTTFRRQGER